MNDMNRSFSAEDAAELEYLDGEYRVITPGAFVVCAVSGIRIPLESLRYWSAELQEAYATAGIAHRRYREKGLTP
jgi:hypothetical protein